MRGVLILSFALVAGCSARRDAARPDPALLAHAARAVRQGCYDCLVDARAVYRRLAAAHRSLAPRLFETDLLIALREKELGVPASDALGEARRLAGELPASAAAGRYLALVDAVPVNELAVPRREQRGFLARRAARLPALDAELAWLARGPLGDPLGAYLHSALACRRPPGAGPDAGGAAPDLPPLLAYRAEACGLGIIAELEAVRRREPRFVETSLIIAAIELALAPREGPGRALAHLTEVTARFPASIAARYLLASYHLLVGDDAAALAAYDRVLALRGDHDAALLGRTISLDRLGRAQDAVASATRLIELGDGTGADGYYWRARGRRALGQLGDARADITAAKERGGSPEVLNLAGVIEYEQADLAAARGDLDAAIAGDAGDCTSRWYLALVQRQRGPWRDAGAAFALAMACYRDRARASRDRAGALRARGELDAAYRERAAASLDAAADADTHQQRAAALMAARSFAAAGDRMAARPLIDLAGDDPELAAAVARLRAELDRDHRRP